MKANMHIKMEPAAHDKLKARAKDVGMPLGDFIEVLLSSLEFRLARWRDVLYATANDRADHIDDATIIKRILKADEYSLTDLELRKKLEAELVRVETIEKPVWTPRISFRDE